MTDRARYERGHDDREAATYHGEFADLRLNDKRVLEAGFGHGTAFSRCPTLLNTLKMNNNLYYDAIVVPWLRMAGSSRI